MLKSSLNSKAFKGFFWTQFFGAFNDNLFKQALVFMVSFQLAAKLPKAEADFFVSLAAGLFILPFFLFSNLAATWADHQGKAKVIRSTKILEIGIMLSSLVGYFLLEEVSLQVGLWCLLAILFLMGTQSALFGPSKYGILPEITEKRDLSNANAYLEMGTFISILLGAYLGGWLVEWFGATPLMMVPFFIGFSLFGYFASRSIPNTPAQQQESKYDWFLIPGILQHWALVKKKPILKHGVIGSSLFWFAGALILQILPGLGVSIQATSIQSNLFLMIFSIGIGVGSLLCGKFSKHLVETGFVLPALGLMALSCLFFGFFTPEVSQGWFSLIPTYFFSFWIGFFGGFYAVPLNAVLQLFTSDQERAKVMALNNIVNALFMVLSSVITMYFRGSLGLTEAELMITLGGFLLLCSFLFMKASSYFYMRSLLLIWWQKQKNYQLCSKLQEMKEGDQKVALSSSKLRDALALQRSTHFPLQLDANYQPSSWLEQTMYRLSKNNQQINQQFSHAVLIITPDRDVSPDAIWIEESEYKHKLE